MQAATKSSHTWVSAQRHEPLRSEGAEICEDTGTATATCVFVVCLHLATGTCVSTCLRHELGRPKRAFVNNLASFCSCDSAGAQLTTAQLQTRVFPKQGDTKIRHLQVQLFETAFKLQL